MVIQMSMNVVHSGNTFQIYGDALKTYDKLPLGTYEVCFHKMMGFYLSAHNDLVVNEENFNKYISRIQGLSPIKIVDEKQKDGINGVVHGWKEGVAVFVPTGKLGLVRRTSIGDIRLFKGDYLNPNVSCTFASALEGCAYLRNMVIPNGMLKEWHSDMVLAATPTLDEFLYHYIIDTTTAD